MSWEEITKDPEFQVLDQNSKTTVLRGWYRDNVASDPEYKVLPTEQKFKVMRGHEIDAGLYQSPEQPSFIKDVVGGTAKQFGKELLGAGESAAQLASGIPGFIVDAGIATGAGYGTLARGGSLDEAAQNITGMQELVRPFVVYQPKTEEGKRASENLGKALHWLIGKPSEIAGQTGQKVISPIAGETAGAITGAGIQTLSELAGYTALFGTVTMGGKKLAGIKEQIKTRPLTDKDVIDFENFIKDEAARLKGKNLNLDDILEALRGRKASKAAYDYITVLPVEERSQLAKSILRGKGIVEPPPIIQPETVKRGLALQPQEKVTPTIKPTGFDENIKVNEITGKQAGDMMAQGKPEVAAHIKEGIDSGKWTPEEMQHIVNNEIMLKVAEAPKGEARQQVRENIAKVEPVVKQAMEGERRVDLEKREKVDTYIRSLDKTPDELAADERLKAVWEKIRTEKPGEAQDISQVVGEMRKPTISQKVDMSLTQWIRQKGGINDEGMSGEVKRLQNMNLIRKDGLSYDRLRENAVEEGFINQDTSVSEFIDLIEKDATALARKNEAGRVYSKVSEPILPKEPRPEIMTSKLDLAVGDKFKIEGEKYVVKGKDAEGNLIIEDGQRFEVDPVFDRIPEPDIGSLKHKETGEQSKLISVQPKVPETKLQPKVKQKEGFEMLDEIRTRDFEARQGKLPTEQKAETPDIEVTGYTDVNGHWINIPMKAKEALEVNQEMIDITNKPYDEAIKAFPAQLRQEVWDNVALLKEKGKTNRKAQKEALADLREMLIDQKQEIQKQIDEEAVKQPRPVVEAKPETPQIEAPTGITEGSRVKFAKSPQDYTVISEKPFDPKTDIEGERYFDVKNNKTGVIEKNIPLEDLKEIKGTVTTGFIPKPSSEAGHIIIPEGISRIGKAAKEFWSPLSTLPENELYKQLRYKSFGDVDRAERFAGKIWDRTKNLEPEVKRDMFRFLDGELSKTDLPENVRPLAQSLQTINNMIGKMLVKKGLLDEATYETHKGEYIKYLYLKHILPEDAKLPVGQSGKLDLNYLRQRKDLTREQQREIGLIEDVSVAEPIGILKPLTDLSKHKFYSEIANNPNWTWQPSVVEVDGKKMGIGMLSDEVNIARKMHEQAPNVPEIKARLDNLETALKTAMAETKNIPDDFVQLPNSKSYGPIAGAFIRKEIVRDIQPIFSGFHNKTDLSRTINTILDVERKGMALFKVGKTALNIPTIFRNTISNFIQLNLSGIPFYEIPAYMVKAAMAMKTKNKFYVESLRNGIFKTNWSEAEIGEVLNTVRTISKPSYVHVVDQIGKLTKFYGKIDDFFKLTKFIEQREGGVEIGKAVIEAQKWGMDYSLAHPAIKLARQHIAPFISYQYKVIPLLAESAVKRPWVIAKYIAIPYLMYEVAKKSLNLTDDDFEKLKRMLPLYIKKSQTYAVIPWKSPEGHVQWVNLNYFFPWSNVTTTVKDIKEKNITELIGDIGIGNPYLDIYTALKSAKGDTPPKDPFTGKDIWNQLDSPTEKSLKLSEWLYNKWAPTMLTREGALGYTSRIGEKDKYGRTTTKEQAIGRLFGLNIVAPTPQQTILEIKGKIKELDSSLMKITKDPTVGIEKKKQAIQEYIKRKKDILRIEASP